MSAPNFAGLRAMAHANIDSLSQAHSDLLAEVTALRASLSDAVELCESLRAERDGETNARRADSNELAQRCESLRSERDKLSHALNLHIELVATLRADRDALRAALDIMVRVFNVNAIEPFAAFAAIEQARAALGRSAP